MADHKPFIFYTKGIECKSFYDEKAKVQRYFVKGHIDSEKLDLVKDIVTKSCMADVSKQFKSRNIKLDLDHEILRKAKGENDFDVKLNLTKLPLGKHVSETLDKKGNLVEFELNPNYKQFDAKGNIINTFKDVWANIKGGFYDAFSIAYIPTKKTDKIDAKGDKIRLLDRINLINVALTGNAINPDATITSVMAKSLRWLNEQEGSAMENKSDDIKRKEIKGYDKDGAHAHTEAEPLGIHNHVEIEKRIQSETDWLSDRISSLSDRLYKLENPSEKESEAPMIGKSKETKSGDIMTEDDVKKDAPVETPAAEAPKTEAPAEDANTEGKSIDAKAFGEMKSQIDGLTKSIEKINAVLEKALPAGHGAVNKEAKAQLQEKSVKVTGNVLDLI